jgi:hypothetical protein
MPHATAWALQVRNSLPKVGGLPKLIVVKETTIQKRMILAKWPIRRFWCNRERQEEHCLGCCTWREAIGRSNPHGLSSTFAVDPNCVQLPLDSSHFEAGVSFSRIAPCAGT